MIPLFLAILKGPDRYRGLPTQALHNARMIHLAAQQMALDRETTGDKAIGWPGDINGGLPESADAADFARILVENHYLAESDLRAFAAAGIPAAKDLPSLTRENVAFAFGRVIVESPSDTIFAVTCNYIGAPVGLDSDQAPFGDKAWVVFRKGGDGSYYRLDRARLDPGETEFQEIIGRLPPGWLGGANPTLPPSAD